MVTIQYLHPRLLAGLNLKIFGLNRGHIISGSIYIILKLQCFSSTCDELERILLHVVSWFPIVYPIEQELLGSMSQRQADVDRNFVENQQWFFAKAFPYFLLLLHTLWKGERQNFSNSPIYYNVLQLTARLCWRQCNVGDSCVMLATIFVKLVPDKSRNRSPKSRVGHKYIKQVNNRNCLQPPSPTPRYFMHHSF